MRSKQARAHDISPAVRKLVKERDGNRCIFCNQPYDLLSIAHYIGRGNGGLGIPENLACACARCHLELDQGTHRPEYREHFREYLESMYPGFPDEKRKYHKWK